MVVVWSFLLPDAKGFAYPEFARVFFWHFPCPILGTVFLGLTCWFSFVYLKTKDLKWDIRAEAANDLTFMFWILTMLSGIIFSELQWGIWWQWDPRQTSFLLVLLVYSAMMAFRMSLADETRRAANTAAFVLASAAPILFLIYIFPYLPQIKASSFHPTGSIMEGKIRGAYAYAIILTLTITSILSAKAYKMRVQIGLIEFALDNSDGQLEIPRIDPAPTAVVRPILLSDED